MSKFAKSLKPQVISAISKIPSECIFTALPRSRTLHSNECSSREALEDRFIGLLLLAGSCRKSRTYTQSHARTQTRTIVNSSRRQKVIDASTEVDNENLEKNTFSDVADVLQPHQRARTPTRKSSTRQRYVKHNAFDHRTRDKASPDHEPVANDKDPADTTYTSGVLRVGPKELEEYNERLPRIPRGKYREMVDIYGMPIEDETSTPSLAEWEAGLDGSVESVLQYPLAPRLTISAQEEDRAYEREQRIREALTPEHMALLDELHTLLHQPRGTVSQTRLWRLFSQLPHPQVLYMRHGDIDRMFHHQAWVEYKSSRGAKDRIFHLLEQCNTAGIQLSRHHWTTAITFAGRQLRNVETEQVREAIEMWMKMEQHGIRADPIVFNVLFDVAAKAERFALADTIHNELKARKMAINRYLRCSMIQCAGLRQDGDAVRTAFNEFVNAGEVVDTSVMNLVIRSLIRSSEGEAAEHVFSNMKSLHAEKFPGVGTRTWQERRALTKALTKTASALRKKQKLHEASFFGTRFSSKEHLDELQRLTPIHPDESTYRIMIGYHALVSGDIARIQDLLQEMKAEGFHVHGSVYVNIFWGFVRHGGYSFSVWTPELLERFWLDFVAAVPRVDVVEQSAAVDEVEQMTSLVEFDDSAMSEDNRPVHFSILAAKNIMHAFLRCCGKQRMLRAWQDIRQKWQTMSREEEDILQAYCRKHSREHIWQDYEE